MAARNDAPDKLLNAFRLVGTDVRWATVDEAGRRPLNINGKWRRIPFGELAGAKPVVGRGKLIRYAGRYLLTRDVYLALAMSLHNPRFWWNYGGTEQPGEGGEDTLPVVSRTWFFNEEGELSWRVAPHSTIRAGSPVKGLELSGRGDHAISFKGRIFVSSDVRFALTHGRYPWMDAPSAPVAYEWE